MKRTILRPWPLATWRKATTVRADVPDDARDQRVDVLGTKRTASPDAIEGAPRAQVAKRMFSVQFPGTANATAPLHTYQPASTLTSPSQGLKISATTVLSWLRC